MSALQRRIRLTQLRLLVAISERGSLARAAQDLHVTQPAATKTLRMLEAAVGESLVNRGSGGSVLTPTGEILCKRARLILAELMDAEQELGLWHSGGAGHVVVGALPVAAPMLIPQTLKALAVLAPRVTVEVIEGAYDIMFRELVAGKIDMLVGRAWPGEETGVMTDVLYESTFQLNVRLGHPLAKRRRLTLKDTVAYPWILPPPSAHTRAAIEDMLRHAGLAMPPHPVETTSYQVIRSMLADSDLIAALPTEVMDAECRHGSVACLSVNMDLRLPPISIVRLSKRTPSPAVMVVIEQIKRVGEQARAIYTD